MAMRFYTNLWTCMTEEQIWGNFETDLYECDNFELCERLLELGGERLLRDYFFMKTALHCAEEPFWNIGSLGFLAQMKRYSQRLEEMAQRNNLHPKQKEMLQMIRKLFQEKMDWEISDKGILECISI